MICMLFSSCSDRGKSVDLKLIDNLDCFAVEVNRQDITEYKDLVLSQVSDSNVRKKINDTYQRYIDRLENATNSTSIAGIYDNFINVINSYIPLANGPYHYEVKDADEISYLLKKYLYRTGLCGIPYSYTNKTFSSYNVNSMTKELYELFFGENGTKKKTEAENYFNLLPFLRNRNIVRGLSLCVPKVKEEIVVGIEKYADFNIEDYKYLDVDLDLAKKYFSFGLLELNNTERCYYEQYNKIELNFMIYDNYESEKRFNTVKENIENAFNGRTQNSDFDQYLDYFDLEITKTQLSVYDLTVSKNYEGRYNISEGGALYYDTKTFAFYKSFSTGDYQLPFAVSFNANTNSIDNGIVYKGELFSFDAIAYAMEQDVLVQNGTLYNYVGLC